MHPSLHLALWEEATQNPFQIQMAIQTKCQSCSSISTTVDPPESILTLDLWPEPDATQRPASLPSMLCKYVEPEQLESSGCQACGVFSEKGPRNGDLKCAKITGFPSVLVLRVNRFKVERTGTDQVIVHKNDRMVEFPCILTAGELTFKVCGWISHTGTATEGHYYASTERNGHWYKFDDERVTPMDSPQDMMYSPNVYMLFYKKQEGTAPEQQGGPAPPKRKGVNNNSDPHEADTEFTSNCKRRRIGS